MAGQYSLNFLHRWLFFCLTQAQSLILFLNWKELSSSQLPGAEVGAVTGGDGEVSVPGVQNSVFSIFPKSDDWSTRVTPSTTKE